MTIATPQEPDDQRQVVRSIDAEGKLVFGQVGVEEINYRGRFGALAGSSTENAVAIGEHYFVVDDDEGRFRIGDDVLITSLDDTDCIMWGEVVGRDTTASPTRLRVYVDDISRTIGTFSNWELQVVARPKIGITKDTSTSSINPTAAGPFTAVVTAGKFFPVGGKLLLIPLADRSIALVGKVKAYFGTSLIIEKNSTNATVSEDYDSWAIFLLDAPQDKIQLYAITGLRVKQSASDWKDIDVTAGSVRDSTDTIDLVLPSALTKRLDAAFAAGTNQGAYTQTANLAGTIATTGTSVTGTGTTFLTDFGLALGNFLSDLDNTYDALNSTLSLFAGPPSVISSGGVSANVSSFVITDTSFTSSVALGVTGATYKRGGWVQNGACYGVCIVRKDSDGSVDICLSAFNPSGEPDLPSGYTYYRVIAAIFTQDAFLEIEQPLHIMKASLAREVVVDSTGGFIGTNVEHSLLQLDANLAAAQEALFDLPILESGTYSPIITPGTNLANASVTSTSFIRLGSTVFVSGRLSVDPTAAAGTSTDAELTLPRNPINTFASAAIAHGVCTARPGTTSEAGTVISIAGTRRVQFQWNSQTTADHPMTFSFAYQLDH